MAWTISGFFSQGQEDLHTNTVAWTWDAGTWNVALYNNSITPDYTASAANCAYAVDQWVVGNEVDDPAPWPAGGPALANGAVTKEQPGAGQVQLDADDQSEVSTTLVNARGCLLYMGSLASPVVDQGYLAVNFGSDFSTTNGTFAITWDTNGVAFFDVW
jgi:hypothetical protein